MGEGNAPQGGARTVLVVDDQRTFADLLRGALDAQPDLRVPMVAYDLASGLAMLDQHRPDVVILDLHFEGEHRDGLDAAHEIRVRHPHTRVVLLSGMADPTIVARAAAAGVSAVLAKNGSVDDVLTAVRNAGTGFMVDPALLHEMVARRDETPAPSLTPRESDVLAMLALGMDARAISEHLDISLHTCRSYIKSLLGKFDAHSQLECVATARRLGLLGSGRHANPDPHRVRGLPDRAPHPSPGSLGA